MVRAVKVAVVLGVVLIASTFVDGGVVEARRPGPSTQDWVCDPFNGCWWQDNSWYDSNWMCEWLYIC